jgi:hypothetical protein
LIAIILFIGVVCEAWPASTHFRFAALAARFARQRGARRRARFRASVRRAHFRFAALAARFARQRGAQRRSPPGSKPRSRPAGALSFANFSAATPRASSAVFKVSAFLRLLTSRTANVAGWSGYPPIAALSINARD